MPLRILIAIQAVLAAAIAYAIAIHNDFQGNFNTAFTAYHLAHAAALFAAILLIWTLRAQNQRNPDPQAAHPPLFISDRAKARMLEIDALISDVDGVLTDGGIIRNADGTGGRIWNAKDGLAHTLLRNVGVKIAWISSTKERGSIDARAKDLLPDAIDTESGDKGPRFRRVCEHINVPPQRTIFLGDDLIDLPAMKLAHLSACPADAVPLVRQQADIILHHTGGRGAFRELAELIIAARAHRTDLSSQHTGDTA